MSYIPLIPPLGTSQVLNARKGTKNEIAVDSNTKEFVVFDGITNGGIRMARKDIVEELTAEVKKLSLAINTILKFMQENKVWTKTTDQTGS